MPQLSLDSAGRCIVTSLFWLLVLYSFCSLVGSLGRDLYGSAPATQDLQPGSYARSWCVAQIATAKAELDNQILFQFQNLNPVSPERRAWHSWHQHWVAAMRRNSGQCADNDADIRRALENLESLGEQYDALIMKLADPVGRAQAAVNADLRQLWREPN